MKKIAADRNYNIKKKAFSGADVWTMAEIDLDGDANPHYTLGLFSSKESAMNSLVDVFKFAEEKGFMVEVEDDNDSHTSFRIGGSEYYIRKDPLSDGDKFTPKDFHLYEDSKPRTYEEDLYEL
tara:strand:+ start:129 stop:497 length:369 start_codon:yes stop_codon:yes gene_type:complete